MIIRNIIVACLLLLSGILGAQNYQPNWQSLDARPTPQWFKDAKFGIFIHWGVYAVPGWSSKGNYAEWYQQGLQTTDSARMKFHKAKFGNRTYYDLANDFKAELFNPDDWAKLFEQSGAKYIVLTSKHHDGYALWPSEEANKTWGFPWNATSIGPKRDLLGDLFKAVRKTSVHAGMYYSLYEWFNPLWKKDPKRFAAEHTWPQMKDLINNYQPDVFWTDGDWDAPAETWKSQEFLTWLYNDSPVKDKIVVNDRWGSGIRFKHAGIFTPEYQPDLDFENHYWEESRGMGFSYGYNREEDAWDYNSTQSLVLQLVDKVSRGGNFLLDIGPDEHGKIPPIMQERLLQLGEWLKINGEAIYGTTKWKTSSQWSAGRQDYQPKKEDWKTGGDLMLKLTVDPDPGYAVKEVFYTYNPTTNTLYAILPKYPGDKKIVLKNLRLSFPQSIEFLSTGKKDISWQKQGNDIVVSLPEYNPNEIKASSAYVLKIKTIQKFYAKPQVKIQYQPGSLAPLISMSAEPTAKVLYTTDGSDPVSSSATYRAPFKADKSGTIKAIAVFDSGTDDVDDKMPTPSDIVSQEIIKYEWVGARKVLGAKPGISYKYFEPSGNIDLSAIENSQPKKSGVVTAISLKEKDRKDKFAWAFDGYIKIAEDGIYEFFISSDDGSKLFLNDKELINNDGLHGAVEKTGKAALKKGYHRLRVIYFDNGGGNELKVSMQAEGKGKEEIPASVLYH